MIPKQMLAICLMLLVNLASFSASAATVGIGKGDLETRRYITGLLESMGHTVTRSAQRADIVLSMPGLDTSNMNVAPSIQVGNALTSTPDGTIAPDVTVTPIQDHPLFNGIDSAFTASGFSTIGWDADTLAASSLGTTIASATGTGALYGVQDYNNTLYIGWDIFSPNASPYDLQFLANAIDYLIPDVPIAAVPLPPGVVLLLSALGALALTRRFRTKAILTKDPEQTKGVEFS